MSEKLDFREGAFGFYYQPNYGKWLVIKLVINECLQEGGHLHLCVEPITLLLFSK